MERTSSSKDWHAMPGRGCLSRKKHSNTYTRARRSGPAVFGKIIRTALLPLDILLEGRILAGHRVEAIGLAECFRKILKRSMSAKGCTPDNFACKGFFGRLKNEMFYGFSWEGVPVSEFVKRLNSYMLWYAGSRIKVSLGGLSPVQYRLHHGFSG